MQKLTDATYAVCADFSNHYNFLVLNALYFLTLCAFFVDIFAYFWNILDIFCCFCLFCTFLVVICMLIFQCQCFFCEFLSTFCNSEYEYEKGFKQVSSKNTLNLSINIISFNLWSNYKNYMKTSCVSAWQSRLSNFATALFVLWHCAPGSLIISQSPYVSTLF